MHRIAACVALGLFTSCYLDLSRPLPSDVAGRFFVGLETIGQSQANIDGIRRMVRLAPEARAEREAALTAAFAAFEAARSEENAIWVGRRLAYLGLHEAAVWWYRFRLNEFPASYRLHRHLGHREITLRNPWSAVRELQRARELADGHPNELEPDGMPNALGIPTSTTQGNIDYHLALAHYLNADLEAAATAWRRCVETWATNDDARVAAGHWLCLTLRRLGRERDVEAVLAALPEDPEVIENHAYEDLLRLHAGRCSVDDALANAADPVQNATRAYGVARWLLDHPGASEAELERGTTLLREVAQRGQWESFGRIAAEDDLRDRAPSAMRRGLENLGIAKPDAARSSPGG